MKKIQPFIKLNSRVFGITKMPIGEAQSNFGDGLPFVVQHQLGGVDERILVRAVIDASGTWKNPNLSGEEGLPATGEVRNKSKIYYQARR